MTNSSAKRIVITGAGGMVGAILAGQAREQGREVAAFTSAQWDITDAAAAERVIAAGDVVINCAAYTNVDGAESDAERAHLVNAVGPGHLAGACARVGASLVHISTDYVFGGDRREPYDIDDATNPMNVYGRTKLAGEQAVLAALPSARVVRTSWVYHGVEGGKDFVAVMRRLAAGPDPVEVVADQVGSPTYAVDLAAALLQVADGAVDVPVVHAANAGAASRFEQAQAVFDLVGADPDRVRPVSSDRVPRPAPRPAYTVLSSRRSADAGLAPLRPWRAALASALESAGEHAGYPLRRE
ncbi:dTDP-4-dehydrorhamnose reductase [Mycolicibacterium thermoresistibile]